MRCEVELFQKSFGRPTADSRPTCAVFLAFLILAATVFTLDALPPLLHPLFGGIPTRLYLGTVRSLTMFAGGGAAFLLLEGALRFGQGSSLEAPMTAFALSLFAVPFLVRSLAVAGGQAWGPRYGPVAPLSVLHVGVTASGLWAAMVCGVRAAEA